MRKRCGYSLRTARPGERADILYKVAVINHHVAEDVQDPMLSHREIREAMIPHGRTTPFINETAVRQYYADQSFYKGKRSLKRIVDDYEANLPDTITEYARALVFMGDWLTVQRRVIEGSRMYRTAWAALAEHDAPPGAGGGTVRRTAAYRAAPHPGRGRTGNRRGQLLRGRAAGRARVRLAPEYQDTVHPPPRRNHLAQTRRTRHRRHPLPPPLPQRPAGRHHGRPPALHLQAQGPTRLAPLLKKKQDTHKTPETLRTPNKITWVSSSDLCSPIF